MVNIVVNGGVTVDVVLLYHSVHFRGVQIVMRKSKDYYDDENDDDDDLSASQDLNRLVISLHEYLTQDFSLKCLSSGHVTLNVAVVVPV